MLHLRKEHIKKLAEGLWLTDEHKAIGEPTYLIV
jgi:hypothetical protein